MDRQDDGSEAIPPIDLHLDDGDDGGFGPIDPPDGEGGPPRPPQPEPFVQSRWGVWIACGVLLAFGAQAIVVMQLSRSGGGSQVAAWMLMLLFIAMFTTVFIVGARYIGKHRRGR
jgi:hypothetical protein